MFGTYRTLLALLVVAHHLGGVPAVIAANAVFGFYVLSGYLMTLIMHQNYGYTFYGVSKYALNRFLRIYPIYWVSIALSAIIIIFVGEQYSVNYHPSIYFPDNSSELLKNIFIFFPFRESPRLTPPAWALTVEIFFYICIGLGISKRKKFVLYWFLFSALYHMIINVARMDWDYKYTIIPAASLPFSTGAIIYHYKYEAQEFLKKIPNGLHAYIPAILFSLILLNSIAGFLINQSNAWPFYTNYILNVFMIADLSERNALPFISKTFDKLVGDFSYPIYLIHYQVGLLVVVLMSFLNIGLNRPSPALLFISAPFIFMMAWLLTIAIEQPIEMLRVWVKKYNRLSGQALADTKCHKSL